MLRIGAVLGAVVGVVFTIMILGGAFRSREFGTVVGYVLLAAFYLAAVSCNTAIGLYRARTVASLPNGPYTVIPIVSILLRMAGESALAGFSLLGVGGCLFIWFAELNPLGQFGEFGMFLPHFGGGSGFLAGIWFLVMMIVLAFMLIVFFYFLAESTVVLVDIAGSTRVLRGWLSNGAPQPAASAPAPAVAPQQARHICPKCNSPLEAGASFCGVCGAAV